MKQHVFLCALNLNTFPTFDLLNLSVHIYSLGFIWFYCFIPCNHLVNASQISTWLHLGDVASLCIGRSSALTFMVSHHGISISWAHSVKSQGLKISSILWFLVHVFSWMSEIFSDLFQLRPFRHLHYFHPVHPLWRIMWHRECCNAVSRLVFWRSRLLRGPFVVGKSETWKPRVSLHVSKVKHFLLILAAGACG